MQQVQTVSSDEIQKLVTILGCQPNNVLEVQLSKDETFQLVFSALKCIVLKHAEELNLSPQALSSEAVTVKTPEGTVSECAESQTPTDNHLKEGLQEPSAKTIPASGGPAASEVTIPRHSQSEQLKQPLEEKTGEIQEVISLDTSTEKPQRKTEFDESDSGAKSSEQAVVQHTEPEDSHALTMHESPSAKKSIDEEKSTQPPKPSVVNPLLNKGQASENLPTDVKNSACDKDEDELTQSIDKRTVRTNMPNGMCGREYNQPIAISRLHVEKFVIPEGLGLSFERKDGMLTGSPKQDGDFEIRIEGCIVPESPSDAREEVFVIARLTINPDPRLLWKEIPSDKEAKFHKPDFDSCSRDIANIRMLAASQRGRSHAHKGTHRDDEAGIKYLDESGWYILAVADGAGSCEYSRQGSKLAVNVAINHLTGTLNGEVGKRLEMTLLEQEDLRNLGKDAKETSAETLIRAASKAAKSIEEEARRNELNAKDFSTTLLLLIYKPTEKGHLVVSFSIGDGAIAAYSHEDGVKLLCTPDSGEFAGQTRFLDTSVVHSKNVHQRIKVCLIPKFTSLMAMTDGITDAKFETEFMLSQDEPWRHLWGEIEPNLKGDTETAEQSVLEWLNFWVPGNHDDRSIALIRGDESYE